MGQLFRKGLDRLKIQAKIGQHIVAPYLFRFQFPVRRSAVGGIAIPAFRQFCNSCRNIHVYFDTLFAQDAQHLTGGRFLAGIVYIDILQCSAHIKQNGIDHKSHCLFQKSASSAAEGRFFL